jgi:MFS family permease
MGMLGSSAFSALLPDFIRLWHLSNTDAGWISGIFFLGHVVAVPLLVGSTDRVDARRIYLVSLGVGGLAALAYAAGYSFGTAASFAFTAMGAGSAASWLAISRL